MTLTKLILLTYGLRATKRGKVVTIKGLYPYQSAAMICARLTGQNWEYITQEKAQAL